MDSESNRTRPVPLWAKLAIRWRHRREYNPDRWVEAVTFDEMVWRDNWDLAESFDELNERYESYT